MDVKGVKKMIRKEMSVWVDREEKLTKEFIRQRAEKVFSYLETEQKLNFDPAVKEKVIDSLADDFIGFGPLQKLMDDKEVTEIMVNGPYKIYIEKRGKKIPCAVKFDDETHLRYIVEKMIAPAGRRVDESSPYVDFSLENGSRVNVILPPLSVGGTSVTIRKQLSTIQTAEDLVKLGTIDTRMAKFLVACVKAKINILFSGATGSGKTTTLAVLSSYIDPQERIVTIEDALEIDLRQDHIVKLLTKPANIEGKGEITPRDLLRNTLRMRPTRIILGEIRGGESMDYLQALNSGHSGSLAVIHASDPSDTITRVETLALYASINIPAWAIREQISSGIGLIVQHSQLVDGSRKITYITEVGELKGTQIVLRDIFRYEVEGVGQDSIVKGKFKAISAPNFLPIFKKKGIDLDPSIFAGG